jgi:hypothetical protein
MSKAGTTFYEIVYFSLLRSLFEDLIVLALNHMLPIGHFNGLQKDLDVKFT